LAPSDFHLKKFLSGKHFDGEDDLKEEIQTWLSSQTASFPDKGIKKLTPRMTSALIMVGTM